MNTFFTCRKALICLWFKANSTDYTYGTVTTFFRFMVATMKNYTFSHKNFTHKKISHGCLSFEKKVTAIEMFTRKITLMQINDMDFFQQFFYPNYCTLNSKKNRFLDIIINSCITYYSAILTYRKRSIKVADS